MAPPTPPGTTGLWVHRTPPPSQEGLTQLDLLQAGRWAAGSYPFAVTQENGHKVSKPIYLQSYIPTYFAT